MTAQADRKSLTASIPALLVRSDGRKLPPEVIARLVTARVSAALSQPAQCELSFVTRSGSAAEEGLFALGSQLTVQVHPDSTQLFDGEVTAFELVHAADGAATLRVRAYDRLHRLRKSRHTQVFEATSPSELAQTLTGMPVTAENGGPRLDRVVHHHQHDLELLVEVANGAGLHPVIDGKKVRLVSLEGYGDPVALRLGTALLSARVEANLDRVVQQVRVLGWHTQRAALIDQRADAARTGRKVRLRPDAKNVGGQPERLLVERPGCGEDEMRAAAQAVLDHGAAAAVTVSAIAVGDARLRPGARVRLEGIAAGVAGVYVLTETTHTVDARGYLTQFSTEPPRPAAQPRATTLTMGRVTEVEDPDGCGRVRVSLPTYGDLDAGWLSVLCTGAGPGRGLVALPDVDDTVLLALPHGEPAAGIVLGGLYGTVSPPDAGTAHGRVRRWSLQTAGGQRLLVDDDNQSLILRNNAGSHLDLGEKDVLLHAAGDLVIRAPGHSIKIQAASVDFVQALVPTEGGI
ncbi:type IV secretion protein Rhs [Rhizocola hellebori]|uniref:Type IV secretion protein Rhs n=1 Tax=Rhizocola hellebori TaxID=1392758 RepID=A0A8J3Q1T6_9ACTN|nr:phage baseplate assembly protein V [Rhizocola hellebori]GIH02238.1 type IV secretion protein Rhs [Rhizocola hellebori]